MKAIILTFLLIVCLFGQYDAEISSYTIYWNKLSEGEPIITDTFHSDTVITILWEDGNDTGPGYISPYTGEIETAMVIVNIPALWTDSTAAVSRDVILPNGLYEMTIVTHDIYNNSSGHSEPLFIQVAKSVARIQVRLRLR